MSFGLSQPAAVEATGVAKLFATTPALAGVTLAVRPGTVCALVGGNGAGKTTLLRLVATALRPTAGTVSVFGCDVVRERASVRGLVDLLPSAGGFYLELTALENLRFVVRMRGLAMPEARLLGALARSGLDRVADERTGTYSTGMLRRLMLARLILVRPRLALLDEPYVGLDEDGRELVDELLEELVREGRAALVATHERERAERLAHEIQGLEIHRLERGLLVESAATRSGTGAVAV